MSATYRIREHRCSDGSSLFHLETTKWWWPFWYSTSTFCYRRSTETSLEEARKTIRLFEDMDAITCEDVIHPSQS